VILDISMMTSTFDAAHGPTPAVDTRVPGA
jgi:hypothetical protein